MAKLNYKYYDFSQAEIISKDAVRTIAYLFDNFARLAGTNLSTFLRLPTEISLEGIEQIDYGDLIASMDCPTCLTVLGMRPLNGYGLLELSLNFVFLVLDRLMGGAGTTTDRLRELTEIEHAVIYKIVRELLSAIVETWRPLVLLRLTIEGRETNPQMIQSFSLNERMLVLRFKVNISGTIGHIMLAVPSASFEPLRQKLVSQDYVSTHDAQQEDTLKEEYSRLVDNLNNVEVPMQVILGEVEYSLREIMQLQQDDIIGLRCDLTSLFDVVIKGKVKYKGTLGAVDSKKAVKLVETIETEG